MNPVLFQRKCPFSRLARKKANTLSFTNLTSANITTKLFKYLNKTDSIDPIVMGLYTSVLRFQLEAIVN
ncbi:phosphate acyltransferase [Flavobacterium sp.]|uniref:phosphate acyltransferase n=1 Tax=Flavobacterium sp. TaxID=239 RepID=UPI0039C88F11